VFSKHEQAKDVVNMPAVSLDVFDVTGAGDTVVATLAACLNSGIDLVSSAQLASYAAGIVVGKVGTSVATLAELKAKLVERLAAAEGAAAGAVGKTGVVSVTEAQELIKSCKQRGEKVVFVNGCYDVLHYGHIRYFNKAKSYGQRLVVGVNSDASVRSLNKGPNRPINNTAARMEVVAGLKAVDWVVSFEEQTPGKLVEALQPDILIKTSDSFKTVADVPASEGAHFVLARGGEVVLVDRTDGCSSTEIIAAAGMDVVSV
jgi:D-beta-D-heptose 7-phosphate kinase/D-beta-D-heptose 1-phosphate adenosyltransferase